MENKSNSTDIIDKHDPETDINKIDSTPNIENNNTHIDTTPSDNENKLTTDIEAASNNLDQQPREADADPEEEKTSTPQNESITNASTEVQLDVSASDCLHIRLAGLSVSGDETPTKKSEQVDEITLNKTNEETSPASPKTVGAEKPEKSADLSKSILAGEISDTSERSVEVDEDEPSDYVDDKPVSCSVSDEEMFIEDQDEDVEEEEEFHEVEEEKHKTSQESVGSGVKNACPSHVRVKSRTEPENKEVPSEAAAETRSETVAETKPETVAETKSETDASKSEELDEIKTQAIKNTDWADMMLSNIQGNSEQADEEINEEKPADDDESKEKDVEVVKKELDLDEDVKNPQYIPKKGVFYEHDDRSHDVNSKKQPSATTKKDDEATEVKDSANNKKSGLQEKQNDNRGRRRPRTENDRWNHDLFREEKQKPKSKSELINAYGYDIRPRDPRNQADGRSPRGSNNTSNNNPERQQSSQDSRTSRQTRDNRTPRQNQSQNRSKERRPRRQNNRGRTDIPVTSTRREGPNNKPVKVEVKDLKSDLVDAKQSYQPPPNQVPVSTRRDNQDAVRERNVRGETRIDVRGKRQNSDDRPPNSSVEDKLPPINTVMPPITTWSNKIEDMVKEEASRKESPSRQHPQHAHGTNNNVKNRSNDYWTQNQPNKNVYHDRPVRNNEDVRHQPHYNNRRYQDRDDTYGKPAQFVNRNHYNDRSNQHQEWRRTNNYNSFAKPNDYEPIKTQTFENSRLSQNLNRFRDAREIINERRLQSQQSFQPKVQPGPPGSERQQRQQHQLVHQHQHQHQQQHQQHPQMMHHQHQPLIQQQQQQHLRQHQQPSLSQQAPQNQSQQHHQAQPQQQSTPTPQQVHGQQLQNQRQQQQQPQQQQVQQPQQHQNQQRQNMVMNSMSDGVQDSGRLNANNSSSSDILSSRPIIKTDSYTSANVGPHSQPQPLQQHSQNHRTLGGPMSQQGPNSTGTHLVPSHLNTAGTQAQYYPPSSNTRDSAAAAAALATAYHGYLPGGHSVMEPTRYHMTSQQLSEHGYMTSPGQTNDAVAAASVMHQQGMYTDATTTGGTVASSAYLTQAGSTLSPSTNIPVTGAGPPPLAPVSYLQHSQYPPPPYSNPYSQPQHNQAPPQSTAYPYWTYI